MFITINTLAHNNRMQPDQTTRYARGLAADAEHYAANATPATIYANGKLIAHRIRKTAARICLPEPNCGVCSQKPGRTHCGGLCQRSRLR